MSTSAEDVGSTISETDQADAVADVLMGGAEEEKKEEIKEEPKEEVKEELAEADDSDDVEELSDESTEEVEASAEDDEDVTWEKVLGVEEGKLNFDEDGNMVGVNVKVDGQSSTVNMTDLISGFQNNKAFTQKSQVLSEERKAFDEERNGFVQQYTSKLNDVDAVSQYLEKQLVGEFEGVDWDGLRVNNPAEYAALKQDFSERALEVQGIKDVISNAKSDEENKINTQNNEATTTRMKEQYGKMIENNPTWSNKEVYTKDMGELKSFCSTKYGFSNEDFKLVQDSRLIELIKDASKFHAGVAVANRKMKKPVPQFQKSKGHAPKKVTKLNKLIKVAKTATGAAGRDAQANAVAELLTGGQ